MDAEKLIDELDRGELGDEIRERFLRTILDELRAEPTYWHPELTEEEREAERAWKREMADYLEEQYI